MANSVSRIFSISSYDLTPKGHARLTTMANFFQEMAYQHASQLGFGYNDLKENDTFWVLVRMKIRLDQYPVWDDQVEVETWHRGMDRLFGIRDFRVKDKSGKQLGVGSSAWLVLDSATRRPVRSAGELLQTSIGEESVFDGGLNKIIMPEGLEVLSLQTVRFSDLDIVGHVNNVKYMEWCIDLAVSDHGPEREVRELEINYTHEAMLGDILEISGLLDPGAESYFLARRQGDQQEIFRARLNWLDQVR